MTSGLHSPLLEGMRRPDGEQEEDDSCGITTYNSPTTLAMAINCIIGTGCFGLPFAFKSAGLGLASILLLFGTTYGLITLNYTLELMARTDGVISAKEGLETPTHRITYKKYGFTKIAEVFGGAWGRNSTQFTMVLYSLGCLWSFGSIFASSLSAMVFSYAFNEPCNIYGDHSSSCEISYFICMAIFSAIVLTLSLMELGDQAFVQSMLTVYRVVAFAVMFITLFIKLISDGDQVKTRSEAFGFANWNMFALAFGSTMVAVNFQYNLPDVLQPLRKKRRAKPIVFTAIIFSFTVYLALGIFGAVAFDNVNPLVTLMWSDYTGCGSGWMECDTNSTNYKNLALITQLIVMLFPVINVLSVFPLLTISTGDNLIICMPDIIQENMSAHRLKCLCRLFVAAVPLLLATIFKQLSLVFAISGLFGFALSLMFPTLFQYLSIRYCLKRWDGAWSATYTPFTWWPISNRYVTCILTVLSIFCTGLSVMTLVNV